MSKTEKYKYKHNSYARKPRKGSTLDVNLKGFLCSCNHNEKDCVRECYNLLNKYADILYPPQTSADDSNEDTDIADQLKKELMEITSVKKHRFQVVDSGAKNIVFIKTTLDDPVQLAEKIVSDIAETKNRQSRTLIRLVPIEVTCKAYVKDIVNAFNEIAPKYFVESTKTFSIVYNHRNNNSLKRDDVIKEVADAVSSIRPDHKVNLKDAEISIVIEVIKGIAMIGVVPNFIKYKKYNLHALADEENETGKQDEEEEPNDN